MFCGQCGAKNDDGDLFCAACGSPLTEQKTAEPPKPKTPGKTMASKCPACGGGMVFDPTTGNLKCEYCGSAYTPEEVEAFWREREQDAAAEGVKAEFAEGEMHSYSCSACGAELMADANTAVMRCPYCGNHTIAPAQFSGMLRPEYIIPFAHTKQQAEASYLSYYNKRFLLPNDFRTGNHVEEIQGVYVPFWMYDGRVSINGDYIAYDESTDENGNTVKTARYSVQRQGYLDYEKIPVDASRRMEDDLMDSVEPYQMEGLKECAMSYLPGFLAERYDVPEEECKQRAHHRAEGSISEQTRATIKHDGIEEKREAFGYQGEKTHYALLPVWLLVTRWQDKTYKFAMNGQTGKMVGDLPVSAPKMMAVLIPLFFATMILTIILALFGDMGMGGIIATALLVAGLVTLITGGIMYSSMKPVKKAGSAGGYVTQPLILTVQEEKKIGVFKAGALKKQMKQS